MVRLPDKLKEDPLLEALLEIRLRKDQENAKHWGELLPGILYSKWDDKYFNIIRLPSADIPATLAEIDPNFRFMPKYRLESDNRAIHIGDYVLSLNIRRPYPGWTVFFQEIMKLMDILKEIDLIKFFERISLRYINLIHLDEQIDLKWLNIDLKLGEYKLHDKPVSLRTEISEGEIFHVIHVNSPIQASIPGTTFSQKGILLDIETVKLIKGEQCGWTILEDYVNILHASLKKLFFELLSPSALEKMKPVYNEEGE